MISVLLETPITPEQWAIYSFHHELSHRAINDAIFSQTTRQLTNYVLDPMPDPEDTFAMGVWLQTHQLAHQAFNAVLGIGAQDFSSFDLTNGRQRQAFTFLNWLNHSSAETALRI